MTDFTICSFYTKDTPYEEIIRTYLIPSLLNIGCDFYILPLDNKHTWGENTKLKASFARWCIDKLNNNVVLLDADAELLEFPTLFQHIPTDSVIGVHILDWKEWYGHGDKKELLTGTMFINKEHSDTIPFLTTWEEECLLGKANHDQEAMDIALQRHPIKIYELPLSYCYIKTLPGGGKPRIQLDNPVIIHNQASRRTKKCLH